MAADTSTPAEGTISRFWANWTGRLGFCSRLASQSLELLLPSTCRLCDGYVTAGEDFCQGCRVQLQSSELRMQSACGRCGRPGAGMVGAGMVGAGNSGVSGVQSAGAAENDSQQPISPEPLVCLTCRGEKHRFDRCIALWTYEGLVRQAVVAAKYGSQAALADALGRRLAESVRWVIENQLGPTGESERPDLITPVPSHLWRRVQRGGGGSRVLAAVVAKSLHGTWPGIRYAELLATTRQVKKQAWLGEKERAANVKGAFREARRLGRRRRGDWLDGRHVLLVDDVMTTGATASESSRILKLAGARRVTVAVVARACAD